MNSRITVYTPTYNRAVLLARLYESLRHQSSAEFDWLIIDDGSDDETAKRVREWQATGNVPIRYHWKANGGMHSAHNVAFDLMDAELCICIDSDDQLMPDAITSILKSWDREPDQEGVAGLVGLNAALGGGVIGSRFQPPFELTTLSDLYQLHGATGDKKLVYRTSVVKVLPRYPEFAGEKLVPLSQLYARIDLIWKLRPVDQAWCIVDYQSNGSSANARRQYLASPMGFLALRRVDIRATKSSWFRAKTAVHFGVASIQLKALETLLERPYRLLKLSLIPLAFIAWLSLRWSARGEARVSTEEAGKP